MCSGTEFVTTARRVLGLDVGVRDTSHDTMHEKIYENMESFQ